MAVEMAARIGKLLLARGETLAVAESSTGGLILSLLTDVPGASGWLRGGLVAYTNDAKGRILGVSGDTLSTHGAVSEETAAEMARQARRLFAATWGIGETGITGPQTGRRSRKPAGLTFLAVSGLPASLDGKVPSGTLEAARDALPQPCTHGPTEHATRFFLPNPGERTAVKRAFADAALALLLDLLQQ